MRISKSVSFIVIVSLLLFLSSGLSGCSDDSGKTMKTVKLSGKSKRRFSFKTTKSTTINFNTDLDGKGKDRCKNNGIEMTWVDKNGEGERVTATTGGHIDVVPDGGKVQFVVQNLESFPIKVFVSWKAR